MSCNPVIQSPKDQFLYWREGMERKQEEQAKKMELKSHVEGRRIAVGSPFLVVHITSLML